MDALLSIVRRLQSMEKTIESMRRRDATATSRGGIVEVVGVSLNARSRFNRVRPDGDGASSNVNTISAMNDGFMAVFSVYASSKTIVFKNGLGNLYLASDCTLSNPKDTLTLLYDTTLSGWKEVARSINH